LINPVHIERCCDIISVPTSPICLFSSHHLRSVSAYSIWPVLWTLWFLWTPAFSSFICNFSWIFCCPPVIY
jgi:hypothetical protein